MKLTWLGHACFALEQDGYRIVIDPYEGVHGYPELQTEAHAVLCSHGHHDHNAVEFVTLLPQKESNPFTVRTVETCHDEQGGALRGKNTIHVISAGGVTVAHLGDLGHRLTAEQLAAVGKVDGVLVPVGGVYTVDAENAKAVCDAIGPQWIVPMHYQHPPYGLTNVAGVEDFLRLWPAARHLEGSSFEAGGHTAGVIVPRFGA